MEINKNNLKVCKVCVMDTSDDQIQFDDHGICNHCSAAEKRKNFISTQYSKENYDKVISDIKKNRKGDYDCILGLSGGLDSSYLAVVTKQLDLKPLVVHVDGGWNSELAVKNIESLVTSLNYDLFTEVINWNEMRDLQLSFFKAAVINQDIPQDHAFAVTLYRIAKKYKIKYVLSGGNFVSESILPNSWIFNNLDGRHIKHIHKIYGKEKLKTFPILSLSEYINLKLINKLHSVRVLNYINYNLEDAIRELEEKYNWRYYGGKHRESRFTKFYQDYYLPHKFGIDKRKAHYSSLIVSGQMTREEALTKLSTTDYTERESNEDINFISKKLGINEVDFRRTIEAKKRSHFEYKSWEFLYSLKRKVKF